jgi:hypothetical protein
MDIAIRIVMLFSGLLAYTSGASGVEFKVKGAVSSDVTAMYKIAVIKNIVWIFCGTALFLGALLL